jgi:type IV fimbrial biogenesis protein FimT
MSRNRSPALSRRPACGFTLLELLIALTILGILLGIVIPGLKNAVARVQSTSVRSAITATLFDAQRNATVVGREIVVCPATETQCTGGQDWSRGWIAFIDHNSDGLRGPGEQIIRRETELPAGVRLHGTNGRPRIVYQPNGGSAGTNITFTLCDRRGAKSAQALVLSNGARLRHERAKPAPAAACANGL